MMSLSLAGIYCACTLLARRVCKRVDVYIITLSCTWRIYALSEHLLVFLIFLSEKIYKKNIKLRGASDRVIVDEKGIKESLKEYVEKLMNEENEWDHRILAGVKEGPADCIRIDEAAAA